MGDYILIVDDEYEIREILRLMLTRVGHPVRHAVNGITAGWGGGLRCALVGVRTA